MNTCNNITFRIEVHSIGNADLINTHIHPRGGLDEENTFLKQISESLGETLITKESTKDFPYVICIIHLPEDDVYHICDEKQKMDQNAGHPADTTDGDFIIYGYHNQNDFKTAWDSICNFEEDGQPRFRGFSITKTIANVH